MQFAAPSYLFLGAAACGGLVWLWFRLMRARAAGLRAMAAERLLGRLAGDVSRRKRWIRFGLLLLGVAALFAALARPQAGFRWEEARRKGIDIMLAVDTSKSMLARDVAPNRLERAKLGILDLLGKLEGDRVGLIPFAGEAYLMCPLTLDYDAFRQSLATVDTEIVPVAGTDLANVIRVARKALESEANHKILVLITDGEDLEGEALAQAKQAAEEGVTIHTVGVGTAAGELIPADGGFLRDGEGALVRSRLDEKTLREVAAATGGIYTPIGGDAGGLEAVYREKLSLVPKEELMARRHKVPLEQFPWALALGGLALLLEMLLGDRASRRRFRWPRLGRAAAGAAFLVAVSAARASPQDGERAFRAGAFTQAAQEYRAALDEAPADARLQQNLAASLYKGGDFAGAREAYERALRTEDLNLQGGAYYGLGNTLFRQGEQALAQDPKQTIARWEEALKQYDGALKLDPADQDARFNRDLVARKLEELKRQQQKKEQEKQKQQQQENQQQCDQCKNPQPDQQKNQKNKDQQQQEQQGQPDQQKQDQPQKGQPQDSQQQQKKDQQQQGKAQPDQQQGNQQGQPPDSPQQKGGAQQQDQQQKDGRESQDGQRDPEQRPQSEPRDQDGQEQKPEPGPQDEGKEQKGESQPAPGQDREGQEKKQHKPRTRLDGAEEAQKGEKGEKGAAAQAAAGGSEAREPGRMTAEEARQLLDSLKEGEGNLAFVPQHADRNRKHRNKRSW